MAYYSIYTTGLYELQSKLLTGDYIGTHSIIRSGKPDLKAFYPPTGVGSLLKGDLGLYTFNYFI